MQKCIRRGMEREAMQFACELVNTSKAFCTMVCNRLEIISHEDIDGLSQPHIIPFVHAAADLAKRIWVADKPAKARLPIGNAILLMCRAAKSREADHFNGAVGIPNQFFNEVPEIPDFAYDHHTKIGQKKGRGMEYFRAESTKLIPPAAPDQYEDEFYEWQKKRMTQGTLFDEQA
jgi:replication-associated recombination protein RarA